MATIVYRMDAKKDLVAIAETSVYQQESNVDSVAILLPQYYDDMDIGDFKVEMKYTDFLNRIHTDELTKDTELFQGMYYRYVFPITENFTEIAGNIDFWLLLTKEGCVMKTSSATITVRPRPDYVEYEEN